MDYGKDMQSYILMETWFTQLGLVTTLKIGSLFRLLGESFSAILSCLIKTVNYFPVIE